MKRSFCFLFAAVLLAGSIFAQTPGENTESTSFRTAHYELFAEPGAENSLPSLAQELELRFEVYNRLFRFDPAALSNPLRVRVFAVPNAYESYVSSRIGIRRAGAVYLHYNIAERRELVILWGSAEEAYMLSHQAFIQFFRGFIPNPPTWMREGFAIYFNTLRFDPIEESLQYEENLSWLEAVRDLGSRAITPRELILRDTVQIHDTSSIGSTAGIYSRDFQICSWALVSFFMNSGKYLRSLTESFMVLSPNSSAVENSQALMHRFSLWIDFYEFDREFASYLDSRKTFAELMENGRNAYEAGDVSGAEISFLAAQDLRPAHYAPYYYLGLLYYDEKLNDMAEEQYLLSLENGADEALVSFALGVNAISAGRINDGRAWLTRAATADPDRYEIRVTDLLRRF